MKLNWLHFILQTMIANSVRCSHWCCFDTRISHLIEKHQFENQNKSRSYRMFFYNIWWRTRVKWIYTDLYYWWNIRIRLYEWWYSCDRLGCNMVIWSERNEGLANRFLATIKRHTNKWSENWSNSSWSGKYQCAVYHHRKWRCYQLCDQNGAGLYL